MYEECQEAHEKWLKAEHHWGRSRSRKFLIQAVDRVIDEDAEEAQTYDWMAKTAWNAHKLGQCSCQLRKMLEDNATKS